MLGVLVQWGTLDADILTGKCQVKRKVEMPQQAKERLRLPANHSKLRENLAYANFVNRWAWPSHFHSSESTCFCCVSHLVYGMFYITALAAGFRVVILSSLNSISLTCLSLLGQRDAFSFKENAYRGREDESRSGCPGLPANHRSLS